MYFLLWIEEGLLQQVSGGEEAAGLAVDEGGVVAVLGHQLFVAAALDDPAFLEDQDPVGMDDGGEPVGADEGGPALDEPLARFLHEEFSLGVEDGGRFVEDEHRVHTFFRRRLPTGAGARMFTYVGGHP